MSAARFLAVVITSLVAAAPATASFDGARALTANGPFKHRALAGTTTVGTPQELHGFLLRENDATGRSNTFPRTPAFSWTHVEGARRYEFQLSTSKSFAENAIVWTAKPQAAVATVPVTLPWVTGAKYSWFARVRAIVNGEPGEWSKRYGFNVRPPGAPRSLSSGINVTPGMVRWTPVNGATGYEIVFLFSQGTGKTKRIRTATTAADLREYYTFHNTLPATEPIFWRVRAVREVSGKTKNKLPAVSFGPWSARFRTVEPTFDKGSLKPLGAISRSSKTDVLSATQTGAPGKGPHGLNPGFYFTGATGPFGESYGECPVLAQFFGITCPLYHVYVFTDHTCANRVHVSDLVGSPAYVPRLTEPLALPTNGEELGKAPFLYLADGDEGDVFTAGDDPIKATGVPDEEIADTGGESGATDGGSEDASEEQATEGEDTEGEAQTSSGSAEVSGGKVELRRNSLWDLDWPSARYVWTVVPAVPVLTPDDEVFYKDVVFPEDMCAEGKAISFGKTSEVVTTSDSGVPFASGLAPSGKVVSAGQDVPSFFQRVVIAWKPAVAANKYEIQFSRKKKAWNTVKRKFTPGTQLQVRLTPGTWYYRIRGLDLSLPGSPG
ncbi:MAG: hypothetical protein ACR2OD_11780, partial [Gaiellaceae bacterium]